MTKEQINIAIAESQGWKFVPSHDHEILGRAVPEYWEHDEHSRIYNDHVADYCNDLNAMHEAEKSITDPRKMLDYFNHLSRYNDPDARSIQDSFNIITATAAQRAEAYLRTIGKWNEKD